MNDKLFIVIMAALVGIACFPYAFATFVTWLLQ